MITKASISKVQSLIIPHHTLSKPPLNFAQWIDIVWKRNEHNPSLLTPDAIRSAWKSTVTDLGLSRRVEEANTRAAKAAIEHRAAALRGATHLKSVARSKSLGIMKGTVVPVPEHVDVPDFKVPSLALAFETVPFNVFVQKVQRANEGKIVTLEVAEGCCWEAIVKFLKSSDVRGSASKRMVDNVGEIVKQEGRSGRTRKDRTTLEIWRRRSEQHETDLSSI